MPLIDELPAALSCLPGRCGAIVMHLLAAGFSCEGIPMITKDELTEIAQKALSDLGLHSWSVWYTDAAPEELFEKQPKPETAMNLQFKLVDGRGGFITTFLRLEFDIIDDIANRNRWVKESLKSRISQIRRAS